MELAVVPLHHLALNPLVEEVVEPEVIELQDMDQLHYRLLQYF